MQDTYPLFVIGGFHCARLKRVEAVLVFEGFKGKEGEGFGMSRCCDAGNIYEKKVEEQEFRGSREVGTLPERQYKYPYCMTKGKQSHSEAGPEAGTDNSISSEDMYQYRPA